MCSYCLTWPAEPGSLVCELCARQEMADATHTANLIRAERRQRVA